MVPRGSDGNCVPPFVSPVSYRREKAWRRPLAIIGPMRLADFADDELLAEYKLVSAEARGAIADELFGRYYEQVARWCYRFTGDREAAADLAQDVFLKAHLHLETFRGASRFSTWLYSIVRNESINRRHQADPGIQDEDLLADLPTLEAGPEKLAEHRSRIRRLMEFLSATLDETERTVFTLHYGDDMPLATITRLLGLQNPSGAKAYIVSAKRKLARAARRLRTRGEAL
jgi:RNA polymerase sigma-70 factor (ECF subfamily)